MLAVSEALSSEDIETIAQVIAFIESREIARNANSSPSSLSSLSSYRRSSRQNGHQPSGRNQSPSRANCSETAKLPRLWQHLQRLHQKVKMLEPESTQEM